MPSFHAPICLNPVLRKHFKNVALIAVLFFFGHSLNAQNAQENDTIVLIHTTQGDMKVRLYKETPLHRANFIKLVNQGFYDSLLFHRVIKQFMIQGGDPDSKNAQPGAQLGMGGTGYTIPAEINNNFFHKKGALAAARQGDEVNPKRESSGCQFYIVQGQQFAASDMEMLEARMNQGLKQQKFSEIISRPENESMKYRFIRFQQNRMSDSMQAIISIIEPQIAKELEGKLTKLSDEKKNVYSTIGGTPHLDGSYTVFGEVVEGLEVIDKIAAIEVQQGDRPVSDIKMSMKLIVPGKEKDEKKKQGKK